MADNSLTRRGRLCWYRRPDVGVLAVNDTLLIFTIVFDLLRDHFGEMSCYPEILKVFNDTLRHLCIGQYPTISRSKDYSQFTLDYYNKLADNKCTYYTFKLPLFMSHLLAGKPYIDIFDNTEEIFAKMGILIVMQNDYKDCFGDEAVTGKLGNDIEEGKCTWLAVNALQRFTAAQRAEFEACYGSADAARVKQLYKDVELPALYHATVQDMYEDIVQRISELETKNSITPALLLKLFEMIYTMVTD